MTSIKKRYEAKPFLERMFCKCGGEMCFDGVVFATMPPHYPHSCKLCNFSETLEDKYPRYVFDAIEPEGD